LLLGKILIKYKYHVAAISLLMIFFFQSINSMKMKSLTVDEPLYIARGITVLKKGDFRLNFMQPPLAGILGTLPLLCASNLHLPLKTKFWKTCKYNANYRSFTLFANKVIRLPQIKDYVFWCRIPIILVSVFLGFLVFSWARQLYGMRSGLFALFLYVFSPNILAHSRLVTSELCISCFIFLTMFCFWKLCYRPTVKNIVFCGISMGLALLSKTSGLSVPPLLFVIGFVYVFFNRDFKAKFRIFFVNRFPKKIQPFYTVTVSICLVLFVSAIVLWGGYGFKLERNYLPTNRPHVDLDNLVKDYVQPIFPKRASAIQKRLYNFMESTPLPLITYIRGIIKQARLQGWGHFANFLNGEHQSKGWWYYFFFAFLIKTPLPTIAFLMFIVLYDVLVKCRYIESSASDGINNFFVALFPVMLLIFATQVSFNYGIKYILPAFPFIFVYISRIARIQTPKSYVLKVMFATLCIWYCYSSVSIYPHYLSYFNELVGGPNNGYKYLVDANIDWGQDLKGLKHYIVKHNIHNIKLDYYGPVSPRYYGIHYKGLSCKPEKGLIAVSVTKLQGLYIKTAHTHKWHTQLDCYNWLKKYKPIHKIGYSIFIYNIQ